MELTRRDAAAALAALGAGGGLAVGARRLRGRRDEPADGPPDEVVRATLTAVAAVVYPSEVSGIAGFVETFLEGRLARPDHASGLRETVGDLDAAARSWHGAPVADLPLETRDRLLREVGADTADENPAGTLAERVRYYVVNDLLLALYASPTGGELLGLENPPGHAGGTASYQRGSR